MQPFLDGVTVIHSFKSSDGQIEYFRGAEAESHKIVEEEVVQFVGSYQVFRYLFDVTVLVGRNQFRADRRVDNIEKCVALVVVNAMSCHPLHQVSHQCFGNAGVYGIH